MGAQIDQPLAALAGRQHGIVAHAQLRALGLSSSGITAREHAGKLHRQHRGVFAVGHEALTAKARWLAAVLALGPQAVLSHRSAAALHGLRPTASASVDVLVPTRGGRARRPGVRVHRTLHLATEERTEVDAIPVTSWARTLLDLAAVVDDAAVARAVERSEELLLFDMATLANVLLAHNGHLGTGRLARALRPYAPRSASELQRRFLALCDRHRIPRPLEEVEILGHRVDFLWPRARLVVETDGFRFHRTRAAWNRDREQESRMVVAGFTVLRPTWEDVTVHEATTAARVAALLARPAPAAGLSELRSAWEHDPPNPGSGRRAD